MTPTVSERRMSALEAIYREHHGLVRWVLRARGVPEASLDDCVHDAFLAIFRRLPRRDRSLPLRTWVAGVARNVGFSHRRASARSRQREQKLEAPAAQPRPDELLERREAWDALRDFLDELGPEQREVFVMVEVTGMRVSEVAATMGLPANTLHSRLKVARSRFSQRFEAGPELVDRARRQARADPRQRKRTWSAIVVSTEGMRVLPPVATKVGAAAKAGWWTAPKLTAATMFFGTVGAAAVVASGRLEADAPRTSSVERAKLPTAASPPEPTPPPPTAESPEPPAAGAPAPPLQSPAPSAPARPRRSRHAEASPPSPPEPSPDAQLARTLDALQRARAALEAGHAREALAALDELDARVGALERDRQRLERDAACRAGDHARARRAVDALRRLGVPHHGEDPCASP